MDLSLIRLAARHASRLNLRMARLYQIEQYLALRAARTAKP